MPLATRSGLNERSARSKQHVDQLRQWKDLRRGRARMVSVGARLQLVATMRDWARTLGWTTATLLKNHKTFTLRVARLRGERTRRHSSSVEGM